MSSVIYCRVSSMAQNEYNKGVSLQVQEQLCIKFAYENKLRAKAVHKEVHSVYNKIPRILTDIIKRKKQNIIISSVDRFSRSKIIGIKMAQQALKNKNKLIFVQEKFVVAENSDLIILEQFLKNTENESAVIGSRIKKARNFLISNGMFAGGSVPYGYKVLDKKLVKEIYEQRVIDFINMCRENEIYCNKLNKKMISIAKISPYVPINCYDKNNKSVPVITEPITFQDIADLLNSYGILKRGGLWCPRVIKTAIKEYTPKLDLDNSESQIKDWNILNGKHSKINEDSKNKLGFTFENKLSDSNNKKSISKKNTNNLRRSSRLNSNNIDYEMRNTTDIEINRDIQLFKKFKEFQQFRNLYK